MAGDASLGRMARYVALLRGIGPTEPNMRNEKLRSVFDRLGFGNVQTVISSGNVLFEADRQRSGALEARIEEAVQDQLGFKSATNIRTENQLRRLEAQDPFKGMEHTPTSSLNVTFLKHRPRTNLSFPHRVANRDYVILGLYDRAIFSFTKLSPGKTTDLMTWLDRQFGKEITTRTWRTVQRILKRWS